MYFLSSKMDAVILKMRVGGLEMTTKKLRRAETAAEREAMTVSAEEFEFMWTNRDWSERFLEYVRLAVVIVNKNDRELGRAVGGLAKRGLMADLIKEWILTKDHFEALATLCDTAVCRSSRVMQQLGYSSDDPPPRQSTH
jgi:hypothetical protein